MSKRRSDSARVVDFFQTQPLDVVDAVLGIVRDMAKARHTDAGNLVVPGVLKRRKRKPVLKPDVPEGVAPV